MPWLVAADLIAVIHAGYVAFVVVGFAAILVGWAANWNWVRNRYFRVAHLAMIGFVCGEALMGTTCPLTVWENALRLHFGQSGYPRDFVGYWIDRLIFYRAPTWVFTACYLIFGGLVLSTFWLVPVNWRSANRPGSTFNRNDAGTT